MEKFTEYQLEEMFEPLYQQYEDHLNGLLEKKHDDNCEWSESYPREPRNPCRCGLDLQIGEAAVNVKVVREQNFRYFLVLRPPWIGTHPDGSVAMEQWQPVRKIKEGERWHAHGWVEYEKPLDFEKIWKYDLRPEDEYELKAYEAWRYKNNK